MARVIRPKGFPTPLGMYSHGMVASGELVIVAGQVGVDANGHVPPDAQMQTEMALENVRAVVEAGGVSMRDVVRLQTFLTRAEDIADFMKAKYTDAALAAELPGAIAEIQRVYATTIFPERKADWRVYPNNIGHKDWPGCFRCHDDKHKTSVGQAVSSSDCTSCHTILTQGKGSDLESLSAKGLTFKHPGGELDPDLTCADCHNGGIQK